jgi:hypothetical protein
MWAANYEATERKLRCLVTLCDAHKQWTVWRISFKTTCSQCGQPFSAIACGLTHELVWFQIEQAVFVK